jgi:tRNA threonylcarbamoyladenosine biosynthesis protein TsaB
MATILNIETATKVCSVALSLNGEIVQLQESREKNSHSATITLFIEEVMNTAGIPFSGLDAVAVSMGPGSYTGLRIGVSTAKGICYALDKPLIAISTLQAMAAGMINLTQITHKDARMQSSLFCPMIDARRMEVYNALYDKELNTIRATQAEIISGDSFQEQMEKQQVVFAGDGAEKCKIFLGQHPNALFLDEFFPSSAFMHKISEKKYQAGEFESVAYFEPFYLKDFIPGISKVKGLR